MGFSGKKTKNWDKREYILFRKGPKLSNLDDNKICQTIVDVNH